MKKSAIFAIAGISVAMATMGYLAGQQPAGQPATGKGGEEGDDTTAFFQ